MPSSYSWMAFMSISSSIFSSKDFLNKVDKGIPWNLAYSLKAFCSSSLRSIGTVLIDKQLGEKHQETEVWC